MYQSNRNFLYFVTTEVDDLNSTILRPTQLIDGTNPVHVKMDLFKSWAIPKYLWNFLKIITVKIDV